ncbi:nuclear transport factor 2 family protein [Kitasatospora sp. GAS204B]|uniref:nuclear transport factor 2 family protein n=1 Tax=unclassified Kitasatospora TaxID=2633591 RepID=UPI0024750B12|nr:nuclear transport factor 2 family protein [Kitasatospora sp. GAS204B]MDH6118422.1 ketosteroid isomerase-like protein [Kitasatospora sp. GAS204B]
MSDMSDISDKSKKIGAITKFFAAYATHDLEGMREVLTDDVAWTIPGRHPLSGTKRGIEEVAAFFTELGRAGFQADPIFLEANEEYVVDIHRGWSTEGVGQVDTTWALVWHFNSEGRVDRVVNLSGDQHQMDEYVWNNHQPAPTSESLA